VLAGVVTWGGKRRRGLALCFFFFG